MKHPAGKGSTAPAKQSRHWKDVYVVMFVAFDLWNHASQDLLRAGAQDNAYVVAGEVWRMIAACFSGVISLLTT